MINSTSFAPTKVPGIHRFLLRIPFPIEWKDIMYSYPDKSHLLNGIVFMCFLMIYQLLIKVVFQNVLFPVNVDQLIKRIKLDDDVTKKELYDLAVQILKRPNGFSVDRISKVVGVSDSLVYKYGGIIRDKDDNAKRKVQRMHESFYLGSIKYFMWGFSVYFVYDKRYIYNTLLHYEGLNDLKGNINIQDLNNITTIDIKLVYLFQFGFYLHVTLFCLLGINLKTKDYAAIIAHHMFSMILIAFSYVNFLLRIGIIVLLLHEPADMLLQTAKFIKYLKLKSICGTIMWHIFSIGCVIIWFITRVFIFPIYCILPAHNLSSQYIDDAILPYFIGLKYFLMALYVLHIYWSVGILKSVYKAIKGGELDDNRDT